MDSIPSNGWFESGSWSQAMLTTAVIGTTMMTAVALTARALCQLVRTELQSIRLQRALDPFPKISSLIHTAVILSGSALIVAFALKVITLSACFVGIGALLIGGACSLQLNHTIQHSLLR